MLPLPRPQTHSSIPPDSKPILRWKAELLLLYDNAVAESFFASMKVEELSHHFYEEPEVFFQDVAEYVNFYNSKRLHQKLGYKTPDQIEEMYRNGEFELVSGEKEA